MIPVSPINFEGMPARFGRANHASSFPDFVQDYVI